MALSRCLWFLTFIAVRAQKSPNTDEAQSTPILKTTSAETTPLKFLSYDQNQICFNPQYDPYFINDLLSTCPVPKPNIYFNDRLKSHVAYPKSFDHPPKHNFPTSATPWPGSLPSNSVSLEYVPTLPTSGHVYHRLIKYLRNLKNAVDENLLLAIQNRTAKLPKNRVEIKFGGFPPADILPEAFSQSVDNAEQQTTTSEVHRIDEIKGQKMASYLKDYYRRRRKRKNGGSNAYPLPKSVYNDHRVSEPTTFYDKNLFWSEIINQNI